VFLLKALALGDVGYQITLEKIHKALSEKA